MHAQVLKDFMGRHGRPQAELSQFQRSILKVTELLNLKASFEHELSRCEEQRRADVSHAAGLVALERKSNRDWIRKLDNMLVSGVGYGLASLQDGQERYFIEGLDLDGSKVKRCCLKLADGTREYEIPRLIRGGKEIWGALRLSIDQGCVGMPGCPWLILAAGARVTITCDVFHRLQKDVLESVSSAGPQCCVWRHCRC